jgi:hypothetical protein
MKEGYNTITKELQMIKNSNCQLQIQVDHLDKKNKTLVNIKSLKNISKVQHPSFSKSNIKSKVNFPSDEYLEPNPSEAKNCLKVTLPTERADTFSAGNKSHNF